MDLRPKRGENKVAIPMTFDVRYQVLKFKMSKLYISLTAMLLAIIFWVIVLFIAAKDDIRWGTTFIVFIVLPLILRMGVIAEYKFRKGYRELAEHQFTYDYSLFWSIYDISAGAATVYYHASGLSSIFVAFDKDVVVGKGGYSDYDHYEALSNAYNVLAKKDIICTHIDYMDNVGKDTRLEGLFTMAQDCKSPQLRDCMLDMLEYMQWYMMGTYADYDVYCFSSKLRSDLFIDELTPVLNAFMGGNYIRYRILNPSEVRLLVSSVLSLPDFSVTRSCDNLFAHNGVSSYLRVIWTEKDGKREIVNKTRAQLAAEARVLEQERQTYKANKKRRKETPDVEVDLFNGEEAGDNSIDDSVVDFENVVSVSDDSSFDGSSGDGDLVDFSASEDGDDTVVDLFN